MMLEPDKENLNYCLFINHLNLMMMMMIMMTMTTKRWWLWWRRRYCKFYISWNDSDFKIFSSCLL